MLSSGYNSTSYNSTSYNSIAPLVSGPTGVGGNAGGGSSGRKKRRRIPPIRTAQGRMLYPETWQEYSRLMPSMKRGKSPDEEAQEERDRKEEEEAIRRILLKLYEG